MSFKNKLISSVITLSILFSVFSALFLTTNVSAVETFDGVVWKNIFSNGFESGENYTSHFDESGGSGDRGPSNTDANGKTFSTYTNNTGDNLGSVFKRIAQGKNVTSDRWILTKASDVSSYQSDMDIVKIDFDLAKDSSWTCAILSVYGTKNGSSAGQCQLFSVDNDEYLYSYNGSSWTKLSGYGKYSANTWYKYTIIVDCGADTFDVWVNDSTKIISGCSLAVDLDYVDSLEVRTQKQSSASKTYATYVDNVRISIVAPVYTVALNTNGGTINAGNVTSYTEGVGATLPTNVTKAGATFDGWYDNNSFTGSAVTEISTSETGNKTYYAKWVDFPSVTLNTNGGTINAGNITMYEEGVGATLPTNVTRTGYTFEGWYAESDCSGSRVYSISSSATGNKVFYANWITNGTWDKVFSQDFETGSNWETYFSEPGGSGTRTPNELGYTNSTVDNLGETVKRIASRNGTTRTLVLNETASPLYNNAKADIVRISFDIAKEAVDRPTNIMLVGQSGGATVSTGTTYGGSRFIVLATSGSNHRIFYHDQAETETGGYRQTDEKLFRAETWYKITVDINCITDTYDVYLNGELSFEGLKLGTDFDKIYGITVEATSGGNSTWTGTFVDNVRYYVPGTDAELSNVSYSSGTVYATVTANAVYGFGNKVILAAYDQAENQLLGITVTDLENNQSTYNMSVSGLSSEPHHIKAFVWDLSETRPSVKWVQYQLP